MGYRHPMPGFVRACVLLPLAVLLSALAPSHVGRAQSAPPALTPWRGLIDHASVNVNGQAPQASVDLPAKSLSADGRFVLMTSYAWDLVSDPNYYHGVFLRDRAQGTTRLVSVSHDGTPADNGSFGGSMSANGRHIAFMSSATNLVQGDTNGASDIFVRDLDAERTVRVSVATGGAQADGDSYWPVISATGRFVAFGGQASNLGGGVPPYQPMQVYVHDRDADANGIFDEPGGVATSLVSVSPDGGHADNWTSNIRISGDGRIISFESQATNLVPGTTLDGTNHVYVHDRQLNQTTLIDRAVTGGPSAWGVEADSSDLSGDGRYVSYSSISPDIVSVDMNWTAQVFRHDRTDGTGGQTVMVSQLPDGTLANGHTYSTAVSGDGRYVVLRTVAANLASPSSGDGRGSVIVRNMADGTFTRVDVTGEGSAFNHWYPYNVSISADGTAVAFNSDATNVVYSSSSSVQHVFVATAFAAAPASASFPMEGGAGSIEVNTLAMTGWNAVSLDPWITLTDGAGFGVGPRVVSYSVDSNPGGVVRDGRIQLGSMMVPIHQEGDGDTTPPVIVPVVTGTHVNGWYTSDITLHWDVSDPESEIQINQGCSDATYSTDFMLATPGCTATSHGGTSSLSLSLRRDTTAPTVSITVPYSTTYPLNAAITPSHSCSDGGGSGIASCTITTPMDTASPGRKLFTVTATDAVGNSTAKSVEYIVGSGVCVAPNESLTARFAFNGHTGDEVAGMYASPVPAVPLYYAQGVAAQAVQFQGNMYLTAGSPDGRLRVGQGLTIVAWVASGGYTIPYSTIVESPGQYTLAVFPDTSLRWRFNLPTGFDWVDTGVKLPRRADVFTHVAVSYDAGLVKTYVNGRLAHTQQLNGLVAASGADPSITIGGSQATSSPLWGAVDDLAIYNSALAASEIDALALAGSGTLCPPQATRLELVAPESVGYMSEIPVSARLLDQAGQPLAGRDVSFYVYFSADGKATGGRLATTDANGNASTTIQLYSSSLPGTYARGISVYFDGNARYSFASASAPTTVVRGTPTIAWPAPAAMTYGTPLGAQQLNATASIGWLYTSIPGTFTYSPAAGTQLNAGTQTLSVTFTPDDLTNWQPVTATTSIVVNKMTPAISISVGTYTYDKQPHPASVTITGANGEALAPTQVSYNSSQTVPVSAGSYWVSASYSGSANYNPASASSSTRLIIRKYVPTVEMHGGPYTYDGRQHSPAIYVRGAGGDYLYPFGYFFNGWTSTIPVNAGTHTVQVQYNGDFNYEAISVEDLSFVINKATPSIWMFSSNRFYNGSPQVTEAWASGINSVSLTPVVVTYNGSATAPAGVGSYELVATYGGSLNYNAVSTTGTMTILQGTPWLTWADPAPIVYGTPLGATQLNATAPTAGRFYYAQPAGTVLAAGTQTLSVLFVPDDQSNWLSSSKSVTLPVTKATPVVTWPAPGEMVYSTPLGNGQLNATSSVAGSFSYSPSAGTVLSVGTHALSATFTPSDAANYNGAGGSASVTVVKATPSISWPQSGPIVYGTPLGASQLNASSSVPGTFTYSPAAGTVLGAGVHTLSVAFTPADGTNYNSTTASVPIEVAKATPGVAWNAPADLTYGAALGAAQLNASSSVLGTFAYSPSAGTLLPAGTHTLSVAFAPDDAANYNAGSASVTLNVLRATPVIAWVPPADVTYGTPLSALQLNVSASVPGTYEFSPAPGTILPAGSQTLSVVFTPEDAANYTTATASVALNVLRATPIVDWVTPAGITYGAPLGSGQLNATASTAGTFTYSPPAGTVLPAGSHTLSVTFTPDDAANYAGATADVTLAVTKAVTSVSWNAPASITYGTALGATQLNATGPVPGTFTYSPSAGTVLPAGSHTLSVTFTPDDAANYAGSTGTTSVTVARAALTVAANNASKPFGQPLPAFTGTLSGLVGGDTVASLSGALGYATPATASSGVGSYAIVPSGVSSPNYSITFVSGTLTVVKAATVVTAAPSPNPVGFDQPVTFIANVALAAPGLGTPTGYVQFFDGGTLIGSVPVADGPVLLTTAGLPAGAHTLTATYSGDGSFSGSSSTAAFTVTTAAASSIVSVSSSVNPSNPGQAVTFTAAVSGPAGTVSGSVDFYDGATLIGSAPVAGASASFTTSALGVGGHAITARFSGHASLPPSVSPAFAHTVQASGTKPRATTTAVTALPAVAALGSEVALTATVSGSQNKVPTGTVVFVANGTVIGTAALNAAGSATAAATLRISTLPHGAHSISAVYLADTGYRASVGGVKVTVN